MKSEYDFQCSENASVEKNANILIYILAVVGAFFIATTVYFAKKASKKKVT